jgi:hypothetical protein
MIPFEYIGKEVERRAQEGEDVAALENDGPIRYGTGRKKKTRSADPLLIAKARRYGVRPLMRASGTSQHATERYLRGEQVHPSDVLPPSSSLTMLGGSRPTIARAGGWHTQPGVPIFHFSRPRV